MSDVLDLLSTRRSVGPALMREPGPTAEELQQIPGVGPVLSQRIVAAREKAPFRTVEDLRRVSGIGIKTMEKLRPLVVVGDPPTGGSEDAVMP